MDGWEVGCVGETTSRENNGWIEVFGWKNEWIQCEARMEEWVEGWEDGWMEGWERG